MGILVRQQDTMLDGMCWVAELREEWIVRDQKKAEDLFDFLLKHNINFAIKNGKIESDDELNVSFVFNNTDYKNFNFTNFKKVVDKLVEFKHEFVKEK